MIGLYCTYVAATGIAPAGMDIKDCPTAQLKVTVGQLNFPPHLSDRTSKI